MNVLLDTCAIVWTVSEPERLSAEALKVLTSPEVTVYFSPISSAEIACLSDRKQIGLDRHWKIWFNHFVALNHWQCLDITLDVIQEAYALPEQFHRDPADRIIVATARLHNLCVITGDSKILNYPHVRAMR